MCIHASLVVASRSQVETLASQAISSVSSAVSFCPASPLCREREDSFPAAMDPVLPPTSVEAHAKTVQNPSTVMGFIRQGFFGLRVVSPSRSMVKEASLLIQGCKDSLVKADENPALVKAGENPAPIYSPVSKSQLGYF